MKRSFWIAAGVSFGILVAGIATATRNSSGTYSLPSGNPVISGTSISTSWANNTLGDIAVELSSSLDRSGRGGMLAPLRVPSGSVSSPTISWTSDTDTGLYLVGDANPAMTVAGTKRQEWTSAGAKVTGTLEVTGASTLTGGVTAVGATLSDGSLTLSKAGFQQIVKSGSGQIEFGTATGNNSTVDVLQNGAVRWRVNTAGDFVSVDAQHAIKNVFNPVDPQDAATKSYVDGFAANKRYATTVTVSGTNVAINVPAAYSEPDTNYKILITPSGYTGTPAGGSARIISVVKTTTGFSFNAEVAPGVGNSVSFDVVVIR